jgi:glycosyltransferase involved in cell wall biosynthesis
VDSPVSTHTNREASVWDSTTPHTSLIIACYRVAEYLPAFFASLEEQTAEHAGYELIFVIDGCPEDSEGAVRAWMATTDYPVRILSKPNGGVASARNAGLEWARGAWISHPDPDDRLDPGYLSEVERARAAFPNETMFAARAILTSPAGEEIGHTLDARYVDAENSVIDLHAEPRKIHTLGGVAFFKRSVVEMHGLRFDERILQSSDTDFIGHFLLCSDSRYVLVPGARYLYLRRADGSSIVSAQSGNMSRYASLFGVSHRGLIDRAGEECPAWLGNLLLYFVFMLFRRNRRRDSPVDLAGEGELARIREALAHNLARIGAERIRGFDIFAVPLEFRMAWLAAVGDIEASPVEHLLWYPASGSRRVAIYSTQPVSPIGLRPRDSTAKIIDQKRRPIEFLGGTWVYQHVFVYRSASASQTRFVCDAGFSLEFGGTVLGAADIRKQSGLESPIAVQPPKPTRSPTTPAAPSGRRNALLTGLSRLRRQQIWIFSVDEQSDPAQCEALHEYTARHLPDVEARFVVAEGSRHVGPLRASGIETVAEGSAVHLDLMRRAQMVFAPRINRSVLDPFPGQGLRRTWRTALLPHAELDRLSYRDDSTARADFVPVSSALELERVGGRYGASLVMPRSVRLTGLPRHDLLEAARVEPSALVIAPSWPRALKHPAMLDAEALAELRATDFVAEWRTVLQMPELRSAARRVVLLLPDGAPRDLFAAAGIEVASSLTEKATALGSAATVLTDYSASAALDAAYLGRPTVYLQTAPSHHLGAPDSPMSRAAAFREEGFGPVVSTAAAALEETVRLSEHVPDRYRRRIDGAFEHRDGRARERLVQELRR